MGRVILGAVFGVLLGLFLALDLHMLSVWSLSATSEIALMAGGLVLGTALGVKARANKARKAPLPA